MLRKHVFSALVVVLLCAGCGAGQQSLDPEVRATAEYLEQNPMPTPEFLVSTTASGGMPDGAVEICISVYQPRFRADTNAHFIVDGETIDDVESWFAGGRLDAPEGYATYATHCVDLANPFLGRHIATVELSTADQQYTYSWVFHVNEALLTSMPLELPTLAALPSLTPSPATP